MLQRQNSLRQHRRLNMTPTLLIDSPWLATQLRADQLKRDTTSASASLHHAQNQTKVAARPGMQQLVSAALPLSCAGVRQPTFADGLLGCIANVSDETRSGGCCRSSGK